MKSFDNFNVSYFVGVSANDTFPHSIAGGDRNLAPGPTPAADYGYSRLYGLGNDVAVPLTGSVCWSLKIHSDGESEGMGNILLGDGSAQWVTSADFRKTWLTHANATTNWPAAHIPPSPSIRLVFP